MDHRNRIFFPLERGKTCDNTAQHSTILIAIAAILLFANSTIHAALVTHTNEGIVNSTWGNPSDTPFDAFLGEAIRVEYTFDPSTVDSEASIDRGLYANAITDLTVIVGGNTYTSDPGSGFTGSIFVGNNITLSTTTMETIDGYSVSIRSLTGANIGSLPMSFFALILRDYTQSMFDSDALPSAQPTPSDVTNSQIDLFFGDEKILTAV